jgi:Domain of unknown function (DUF4252)
MKRIATVLCLVVAFQFSAAAQDWDPGGTLKRLSDKASKTVDVNLDQSMLKFAAAFLDPKDPQQAQAKKVIANMKGIYVHNLEFEKHGEYSEEDLASLRAPLKEPEWSRIVNVRSKSDGQNVEIYFHKDGEKFKGLVVIATEPTELTFVDIVGPITPEDIAGLGGQFGIPKVEIDPQPSGKKGESK